MMRMIDIISKKRDGKELTEKEIQWMVQEYAEDNIPDYQMSAFLMAVYFNGMNDQELLVLTDAMARSGDMVDLSEISGIKVDKHSTGGVGDKTTLIVAPIVAACGVKVAKMSGRGLGFTGGTVDKLESIPGFQTSLSRDRFFDIVNTVGVSVIGQSENLTPADKKLYALRDVTGTVESIPLIAASIMSKKLAAGSECILLDVKTGSGAFMERYEDAKALAEKMVEIGRLAGRKTKALITNMEEPLGNAIGNSLEVEEAIATLEGKGPDDLNQLCIALAGNMLYLAGEGELKECMAKAQRALETGSALTKFEEMVKAQGGDKRIVRETERLGRAACSYVVRAKESGYLAHINAKQCGVASALLGAGRENKESHIDLLAGIYLHKKAGMKVTAGDPIATLYTSDGKKIASALEVLEKAIVIEENPGEVQKIMVLAEIG
jgi:pyrimidine-nucleoside phosphorylase